MRLTSNGSLSLGAQYPTSKFHFQTDIIVGTGTISNDDNDYTLIKEDTTGAFTDLDIGDEITGGGQKRLVVNKQVISNVTWLTVDTAFNPKLTLNSWTYTQRRLAIKETGRIEIGKNEATPAIIIAPPPTGSASVDRTSIQDCIEKAKTNGGGTVILQKGRYSVNQYSDTDYALALRKGVSLIGASANQTIIEVNNPGRSISAVKFEDDTTGLIHWATVSNIKFNRAQADGSGKKHVGIAMIKTQMCKIENVEIKDFMTGIQVTHWINQVVNVKVSECGIGIHINGKPKVRAVSIKSISGSQSQWTVKLDTAYTDIYAGQYLWQGTNNWLITTAQPDPQNSETVLTAEGDQQPTQTSSEIYYINFLDRNINTIITI